MCITFFFFDFYLVFEFCYSKQGRRFGSVALSMDREVEVERINERHVLHLEQVEKKRLTCSNIRLIFSIFLCMLVW